VRAFAELLDRLAFEPGRVEKQRLLLAYLRDTPDPDRGWALAALTGALGFARLKPAAVRELVASRVDPTLFALSYDYVGDLAETVSLIWPGPEGRPSDRRLGALVDALAAAGRDDAPRLLAAELDRLDALGRWALIKLLLGGLRVGVSARLARTAVAELGGVEVAEIEAVWPVLAPPYAPLFAWLEGRGSRPSTRDAASFRPMMLAHALGEDDRRRAPLDAYQVEWKWDGIRAQLVGEGGRLRLYARSGQEIDGSFPELMRAFEGLEASLDGELLVVRDGEAAPFAELQRRLNRKRPSRRLQAEHPVALRVYDLLDEGGEDLRPRPLAERRARLEAFVATWRAARPEAPLSLSPLVEVEDWQALDRLRAAPPHPSIEGLMLKRLDSAYLAGRPRGPWFKYKRAPHTVDAVLMYAQRGHGRRSSFYSDYTFGLWRDGALVPVGKAYFGFTDAELRELDAWIRGHTTARFGPVREVAPALVLEVAFEGVQASSRHKSGVALRFPRIHRIRWDRAAESADRLESLLALLERDGGRS
jgi:DNA ligase-1